MNHQPRTSVDTSNPITSLPDSPDFSTTRRKNTNTLSWSSTSSSFSSHSMSTLSSTATPMTAITTSTLPLMMIRSSSRTLPLLISDDDEDDDDEHVDDDDLLDTTVLLERNDEWNQQTDDEDGQQMQQQKLHQQRWYRRVTKSLTYACSHGNTFLVQRILEDERLRPFLNVDGSDDKQMGTTPLIYASCFGFASIVQLLLDAGAKVDGQDKVGWSPLMWATTNNHKTIVELLLAHGASWKNQTSQGRTVLDFVDYNNQELVHSLTPDDLNDDMDKQQHQDFYDRMNSNKRRQGSIAIPKLDLDADTSFDYKPPQQEDEDEAESKRTLVESVYTKDDEELDDLVSCEASMESLHHFVWNRCLPDQMFVFAEEDIDHILQVTISGLHLPMKTRQEIWVPSNVLFLCARFAHYYSGRELLTGVLGGAISMIASVLHKNKGDIHTTAFWMANLSQLLYYLKKDTGLVVATAEQQLEISELVSETYLLLVTDSEKRIDKILEASMMDHDLIGADPVDFADDWQRFFRRRGSSRRPSSMASLATISSNYSTMESAPSINQRAQEFYQDEPSSIQQQRQQSMDHINTQPPTSPMNSLSSFMSSTSPTSPSCATLSPHSITSLLSSILYVLQSYEVHPAIIVQAIAQFFHFMSCEIFNRILTNKKLLCRSKALQIRMNLSIIEDWVREQQPYLPIHLTSYFDPLIQLLQLLQCVSQLNELATFVGTTTGFELLNPLQIKRCVLNYRYEVDEPRLPDEVEKYTVQLVQDAVNNSGNSMGGNAISRNNSQRKRSGATMERSPSRCSVNKSRTPQGAPMDSSANSHRQNHVSSRPTSVSSIGSLIMARWTSSPAATASSEPKKQDEEENQQGRWDDDDLDDDDDGPFMESEDDDDDNDMDDGRDWLEEKRDSKYMLPFSLPTSTTMIHYATYQQQQHQQVGPLRLELHHQLDDDDLMMATMKNNNNHNNSKIHDLMMMSASLYEEMRQKKGATERERMAKERTVIPTIPQDWMDRLDRRQKTQDSASKNDDGDHDAMDRLVSHGARRAMEVC